MQKETKMELKSKYDETVKALLENSKDREFAEQLISDLLSYKGRLEHEPTLVHLPMSKIVDSFDGETFSMNLMKDGTAVYHMRGGMDIIARPNMASLNQAIASLIEDSHRYEELDEEGKKAFDTEMQASCFVMNVPAFAFSDIDFMFETASSVIKFLSDTYEDAMSKPLQEETSKEDQSFENASLAMENIQELMSEHSENAE